MSANDDPRQILAILNSLGFIGITAPQLKAFMKDLKTYKKVKEREKQLHKEEIKQKLLRKQQNMVQEVLSEHSKELGLSRKQNEMSNISNLEDSVVEVKIQCISKGKENQEHRHSRKDHTELLEGKTELKETKYVKMKPWEMLCNERNNYDYLSTKVEDNIKHPKDKSAHRVSSSLMQSNYYNNYGTKKHSNISEESLHNGRTRQVVSEFERPCSAPNIMEQIHKSRSKTISVDRSTTDRSHSVPHTKSSTSSTQKSFIRPWRLQPEFQRNISKRGSDPVALYQKYQKEWKKIPFPGEAKHTSVRWAIREKMLGVDPHPPPIPRKSTSVPILKKK